MFSIELIIIFILLGSLVGLASGLLGIGGGVLLVPSFIFLFENLKFPSSHIPHLAIGTSLSIIFFTSLSAAFEHYKNNNYFEKFLFYLIGFGILGTFLGSTLTAYLPADILKKLFGIFLVYFSIKIFLKKNHEIFEKESKNNPLISSLIGFLMGFLSALLGIGGATVGIPLMWTFLKTPVKKTIGTALIFIVFISFFGSLGHLYHGIKVKGLPLFSLGFIIYPLILLIAPTSIIFAHLGVKLSLKTPAKTLSLILAVLLLIIGLEMIII